MPIKGYRENHERAWCYFKALGLLPITARKNEWCLHHKDPSLKTEDPERYNEWRVEDLVPMLKSEHTRLHQLGRKKSPEERKARSLKLMGHSVSEETRRKISESCRGRKIPEDEIRRRVATFKKNHPKKPKVRKEPKPREERGKFWITNGVENRRISKNEPIPNGWRRGRLGFVRKSSPKLGPMSEEHKRKISEARMGMKFSEEHKQHLSESHRKMVNGI